MTKGGFSWLYHFKFYLDRSISNPLDRLTVKAPDATFPYGWEYHGVLDELVQTPIMDRVYLTLTQALDDQLGGAPFGPGTTEFVKVLMLNRVDLVQSNGKNFLTSQLDQVVQTPQHDFGLRALEAVLASAGILKRGHLLKAREQADADDAAVGVSDVISEKIISIQSVTETVVPMLVADDVVPSAPCFPSLLADIFSNMSVDLDFSRGGIYIIRKERKLVTGEH
ncbi:hypothetical protein EV361DRAFT_981516 [Lentinula raphanica]|nr:hypothetical protein EV361DRAFT_981516 [Lentinula raphanica]